MSVPRPPPFPPKLPPWGWPIIRTLLEGSPKVAARPRAMWAGDWKAPRQVMLCSTGFHSLMQP
jgi:hypothetical protein